MKRLEVSGAVRLLYWSLGFKGSIEFVLLCLKHSVTVTWFSLTELCLYSIPTCFDGGPSSSGHK